MKIQQTPKYKIALIKWQSEDGIGQAIYEELRALGHQVIWEGGNSGFYTNIDVIFLYGPFGEYLHLLKPFQSKSLTERPTIVFWNTEGLPDPRLPQSLAKALSILRSTLGRLRILSKGGIRFRYLGDFLYAHRQGLLDVLVDISAEYARIFRHYGIDVEVAPFGSFAPWHADLKLERDIDVLWMGKFGSKRREKILRQLRHELMKRGVEIYMVDNVEHPFVFDDERTELLNRTKITLNILRTWYDENSLRMCMAIPNGSLIVSEPILAHVPQYEAGKHYVSAPIDELAESIVHYLKHPEARDKITMQAHHLLSTDLTFAGSMEKIMRIVSARKAGKSL